MQQILTEQDLEELSGHKRASGQIEWLGQMGINFFIRKDGKPSVTWHFVNNPYGMKAKATANDEPDFGAM